MYSEAKANILALDLPDKVIEAMLKILEDFKNDFEPEQCIVCRGSGEGQHSESTCFICKGKGEIVEKEERDYDLEAA